MEPQGVLAEQNPTGVRATKGSVASPPTDAPSREPWFNGPTEELVTKLKPIRRQRYGRGKLELLRARLIAPP